MWLAGAGAHVHGYALDPKQHQDVFNSARVGSLLASDTRANILDVSALTHAMQAAAPEVVFHLAAQPLVLDSYVDPLGTFATNVMGTAHVLHAARTVAGIRAIVIVTTDKVYENAESGHHYRESDTLGGRDPYSASKAASELITHSYRASFFGGTGHRAAVATARAGNVIGGGDWADHRLIPDCVRAFSVGVPLQLRHPEAIRPWQHVLEPVSGYIRLAERLLGDTPYAFAKAWNFGPDADSEASVGEVARGFARAWGATADVQIAVDPTPHEAGMLRLDSTLAREALDWSPRWQLSEALKHTAAWYQANAAGADMKDVSQQQIAAYRKAAG